MADTNNLKQLITAFRNETQSGAITPEVLGSLLQRIADDKTGSTASPLYHIEAKVMDGFVYITGAQPLIEQGYTPYLFRHSVKTVRYRDSPRGLEREVRKGWNRMGNHLAISINSNGLLQFNTSPHKVWHLTEFGDDRSGETLGDDYDASADSLMQVNITAAEKFPWGKRRVRTRLCEGGAPRLIRLPFAVAFVKDRITYSTKQSEIVLVSNHATFSVVCNSRMYDTGWHFSR